MGRLRLMIISALFLWLSSGFVPAFALDQDAAAFGALLVLKNSMESGRDVPVRVPQIACPGPNWKRENVERNYRAYMDEVRPLHLQLAPQKPVVKALADHQNEVMGSSLNKFYATCEQINPMASQMAFSFQAKSSETDPNGCGYLIQSRANYAEAERLQKQIVASYEKLRQEIYDLSQKARAEELRQLSSYRSSLPEARALSEETKKIYGHGGYFQRTSGPFWRLVYGIDVLLDNEKRSLSFQQETLQVLNSRVAKCGK